jgi:putative transposase
VRRIVLGLDRGLLALAHHDSDVYRDEFELVLRRESAHSNDIWQADHTELDVMVLDEAGAPVRPWLTAILDDHSRAIAGYTVFLGDPTALQTALALRQAVWRKADPAWQVCGLPGGPVQRPRRRLHQRPHRPGVRRREGAVGPRHTGKTSRQGEGGAAVRHDHHRIAAHVARSCTPSNHGKPVIAPALTLSQLDAAVGRYIVDTYHQRVHPETGQTPATGGRRGIGCLGCRILSKRWTCCC